jgi:glycerate kinase
MRIVLAPDSFKDSLSAVSACGAMSRGVRRVMPDADIVSVPVADGGEGTADAMVRASGGVMETVRVSGPLAQPVEASLGILGDGKTAVIELAQASGLERVPKPLRNPLRTTTFGTGELVRRALDKGFRRLVVGIGGSATTDCGSGMAQALGARFFRMDGSEIREPMTGGLLGSVDRVDLGGLHPGLVASDIRVACDVDNPLLGARGAVHTYSRQKGASEKDLEKLEAGMARFIGIVENAVGRSVREIEGSGAAGGAGAGLLAFFGASLVPGIALVLDACGFDEKVRTADWVFTGEGKVDAQTASGKAVAGVARAAARHGVPVIAIAGQVGDGLDALYGLGVVSVFSICPGPMPLDQSLARAETLVEDCAERIARMINARRVR